MLSLLSSLLVSLCLLLSVLLPAARAASCSNLSVVEIGPYFVDLRLNTPYIAVNVSAGVVLNLTILVLDGRTSSTQCVPLVGAMVDTWSTLWNGKYSDESAEATQSLIYLRGFQLSNSSGYVQFNSRYPGWYSGRTPHIHFRVRLFESDGVTLDYDDTTQLFFDDAVTDALFNDISPYNTHTGRDTYNSNDRLWSIGNQLTLAGSETAGFTSTVILTIPLAGSSATTGATTTGTSGVPASTISVSSSAAFSGVSASSSASTGSGSTTGPPQMSQPPSMMGRPSASSSSSTGPASAYSDPRFVGFWGQSFYVSGAMGGVYSLLSDAHVQVNAYFVQLQHVTCPQELEQPTKVRCFDEQGTYFGVLAIHLHSGDYVRITAGPHHTGFHSVSIGDSHSLRVGERYDGVAAAAATASTRQRRRQQAWPVGGLLVHLVSARRVVVRAGLYVLTVDNVDEYVDVSEVDVGSWDVLMDMAQPDGLLGRTWDPVLDCSHSDAQVERFRVQSDDILGCSGPAHDKFCQRA